MVRERMQVQRRPTIRRRYAMSATKTDQELNKGQGNQENKDREAQKRQEEQRGVHNPGNNPGNKGQNQNKEQNQPRPEHGNR